LVSALVALLIGAPFAILVERSRPALRRVCWALGLMALMVPPYLVAESWIVLLGPAGRFSRPVATLLGFGPRSVDPVEIARFAVPGFVYTKPSVGAVMGGCFFPIIALAVASAFRRTDKRIFESARIAQGTPGVFRIAAHVLVPPALGAALLVFAVTLTEFAVPQLLRVRTVGEAVYERIQEGDLATAAALGLPLLPLVVAAGGLGAFVLMRSRLASLAGLEGKCQIHRPPRRLAGQLFRRYDDTRRGDSGHHTAAHLARLARRHRQTSASLCHRVAQSSPRLGFS